MNPTPNLNSNPSIKEFGTPRENEERRDGGCGIVYDPATKLFAVGKQHQIDPTTGTPAPSNGSLRLFSGGVSADEDITEGILREVREESGLYDFSHVEVIGQALTHYHNTLRNVNRVAHATCLLIILKSADLHPVELEEHETFSLVWVSAEELLADMNARNQNKDNDHWIYFMEKALVRLSELLPD